MTARWECWISDEAIREQMDDAIGRGDEGCAVLCVTALAGDDVARTVLAKREADRPIAYALTDKARAELAGRAPATSGGAS